MLPVLIGIGSLLLLVFALVDVITGDASKFKNLDKLTWVFIVVLLPLVGSILWLAVGREYQRSTPVARASEWRTPRPATQLTPEAELAAIEAEIEFHENQARIRRLEAELEARRKAKRTGEA